jgi:hypothetical protein
MILCWRKLTQMPKLNASWCDFVNQPLLRQKKKKKKKSTHSELDKKNAYASILRSQLRNFRLHVVPASRVHLQASHFSSATFAISFYKELQKKDKGSLAISIREARTLEAEKQRKALAISVPTAVPFVTNTSSSSSFPSSNATSSGTTSSTNLAPTPEQSRFINSIDVQLQQLRDAARCSAATPFDYAANVHLQFLKLVYGGPGCGKTFCIQKIVKLLETYNIGYMCLAETGIAACLMPNGHTVCSGLGIQVGRNVKNKSDSSLGKTI